jgi:hypothetical protein
MKHFRPAKGWKKEIEEISLGFVIAILVVVGVSAKVSAATGGPGQLFWGKIVTITVQCVEYGYSNTCLSAGYTRLPSPSVVIVIQGNRSIVQLINPALSRGRSRYPTPGGHIIGYGTMGSGGAILPTTFWMY